MLPSRHIIASVPLGIAFGFYTQSSLAGILCFFSGTLMDFDHLIEYTIHRGLNTFNLKKIYLDCRKFAESEEEGGVKRLYLMFHGIEIAILLWISATLLNNIYLLAVTLGYTVHLLIDIIGNKLRPKAYFLTFRIISGFDRIKLIKEPQLKLAEKELN